MQYFIIKILKKQKFQQTAFNHSSKIDLKNFMNVYKKCIVKPYSFLVVHATLGLDNPLRFRKYLLGRI